MICYRHRRPDRGRRRIRSDFDRSSTNGTQLFDPENAEHSAEYLNEYDVEYIAGDAQCSEDGCTDDGIGDIVLEGVGESSPEVASHDAILSLPWHNLRPEPWEDRLAPCSMPGWVCEVRHWSNGE